MPAAVVAEGNIAEALHLEALYAKLAAKDQPSAVVLFRPSITAPQVCSGTLERKSRR
jgi:hypothetical protein